MSNSKLGITGEFVAIIKSKEDSRYGYFVSKKARRTYNFVRFIFPESSIKRIFDERLALSRKFDDTIERSNARQVIELACGYSLRVFEESYKNPELNYVDIDFPIVVEYKRSVLEKICRDEKKDMPVNYHLISADLLKEDLSDMVSEIISKKPTLVLAEGLTSYFDNAHYGKFVEQVTNFLKNHPNSEFFSHEQAPRKHGVSYRILRSMITLMTHNKSHQKFNSQKEFESYLESKGISKYEIKPEGSQLFYSIKS